MGSFWAVTNPDRPGHAMPLALCAASEWAATMLTVQYGKAHPEITFNALEPGTTATDMTAAFGIGRPVDESARVVVRLATLDADGPTGTLQDEAGELALLIDPCSSTPIRTLLTDDKHLMRTALAPMAVSHSDAPAVDRR